MSDILDDKEIKLIKNRLRKLGIDNLKLLLDPGDKLSAASPLFMKTMTDQIMLYDNSQKEEEEETEVQEV